jgi:hypothetical protein
MKLIQLVPEDLFKYQIQVIEQNLPLIVENVKGSRKRFEGNRLKRIFERPEVFDKYTYYVTEEGLSSWRQICANKLNLKNHRGDVPNIDGTRLINEFKRISKANLEERINMLTADHKKVNDILIRKKGKIDNETAEIIFPITKQATLMAGVAMSDHDKAGARIWSRTCHK